MAKRVRVGGTGRPSKGEREFFGTRVPKPVADVIRRQAEDLDVSFSELIADVLARGLGLPEHAVGARSKDQEELPLPKAS